MNAPLTIQRLAPPSGTSEPPAEDRVSQALEEYAAAIERGQPLSPQELLTKYADVADELAGCLDSLDFIRQVAPQLHDDGQNNARAGGSAIRPLATLGDFRILREIGRGGMGVVYEAEQLSLGRRVALKVLPFAAMLDKQQLTRFKNEARAAATLDHPNIVAIYSVGAERGVHYYAMQLIEGQSLAEVIAAMRQAHDGIGSPSPCGSESRRGDEGPREGGFTSNDAPTIEHPASSIQHRDTVPIAHLSTLHAPISSLPAFSSREYFRTVARLGIQAAEALDHAHQNGILHRDIKPANLLLDDAGKLWITDFGLARIEQDAGVTMTGDLLGTLRYMSPEQALAKRVVIDHRSDIYSLGVTLYELLTLQPVYAADDRQELLRQIAFDEPNPLRKADRWIPEQLEIIIHKAIRKSPEHRYTTAHDLADDLRRYVDNQPIKAKPPSMVNRASMWTRRHRPLVVSATLSAVALVLTTLAILAFSNAAITRALHDRTLALNSSDRNYKKALEAVDQLLARVGNEKLAEVPQLDQLRMDVLKDTLKFYESFVAENPGDLKVQFELAKTYRRVAMMYQDFRRTSTATRYRTQAIDILDEVCAADSSNPEYRYELAVVLFQHQWLAFMPTYSPRSIDLFEGLVKEFPENTSYREGLADALRSYSERFMPNFHVDKPVEEADKVRGLIARTFEVARSPGVHKRFLGHAYDMSAFLAGFEKRYVQAEADFRDAVRVYSEAVAERPTDGRTREHQAKSCSCFAQFLERRGDEKQAEQWYRTAVDQTLELTRDFPQMANFRRFQNEIVTPFIKLLKKQNRTQDATELLARITPESPRDFLNRGRLYKLLGRADLARADCQKAVEQSQQALRLDPTDAIEYFALVGGLIELHRRDEAHAAWQSMTTPDVESLNVRAQLHHLLPDDKVTSEDRQQIIDLHSQLVAEFPGDLNQLARRAEAYANIGQYDKALLDLDIIMQSPKPTIGKLQYFRGQIYMIAGRYNEALDDLGEVIRLEPEFANPYIDRAYVSYHLLRLEDAIADLDIAISIDRMNPTAWNRRGVVHRDMKQFNKAIEDYEVVLATIDKNNPDALNSLAQVLATATDDKLLNGKRAVELATKACELTDFKNASYIDTLAAAYAEAGDFTKAIECCQKAINLVGEDERDLEWAQKLPAQLESYQAGRPWRIGGNKQPSPPTSATD